MEVVQGKNVDLTKFFVLEKSKAKVKWKCPEYAVKMLEEGAHADITFEAQGGSVKTHRSVLSCVSLVFAAMFQHDMKEKITSIVQICDMTIDALKLFLLLLYTIEDESDDGIPELNVAIDTHFEELHDAIMKYQVGNILGSLHVSALKRNLNSNNCWIYYASFNVKSTPSDTCLNYILGYYEEVIKSKSFLDAMKRYPQHVWLVVKQGYSPVSRDKALQVFNRKKNINHMHQGAQAQDQAHQDQARQDQARQDQARQDQAHQAHFEKLFP